MADGMRDMDEIRAEIDMFRVTEKDPGFIELMTMLSAQIRARKVEIVERQLTSLDDIMSLAAARGELAGMQSVKAQLAWRIEELELELHDALIEDRLQNEESKEG